MRYLASHRMGESWRSSSTAKLVFTNSNATPQRDSRPRGNPTRLVWAPDGRHIVFESGTSVFWTRSDGAGDPGATGEFKQFVPWSMSSDGRRRAYFEVNPDTGFDIWTLPLDFSDPNHPRAGKPEPFLRTPADELIPMFSPDGRWIAYRSNESGGPEIYVRPFPAAGGGKWQISSGGGLYGLWSKDGHELYYETTDNRIMVVDYTVDGATFVSSKPRLWSDTQIFYTERRTWIWPRMASASWCLRYRRLCLAKEVRSTSPRC
jgi:Tol biopolymer transport system component